MLLVPALLYALAFLFMPFSVIGVKSRLEVIEVPVPGGYGTEAHGHLGVAHAAGLRSATVQAAVALPKPTS